MSLILLLDLDDTLLDNNIEEFLPHYLSAFSEEVAPYINPDKFVSSLLKGTHSMVENRRPDKTLQDCFNATFFPLLGIEEADFQGIADKFYTEIFPNLQKYTRTNPQAVNLVELARERKYRMAIATNPLFPLSAVLHRLDWANLPAEKYPFEVIASYETFHFTKPDPAYFIEVIGRMGWPDDAFVMVGDDYQRDIVGCQNIGLPVFWIDRSGEPPSNFNETPSARGEVSHVMPWLNSVPIKNMQPKFDTAQALLAILRATPAILDGFYRNLVDDAWRVSPGEDEWSVTEVVCHLRDVEEEVNLERITKVLQSRNPFLPGEDTDPWADQRRYKIQDGARALKDFITARMTLLEMLEALQQEDWERPARHAIFGPTRLIELVNIISGHDRLHVRQIYNVLGEEHRRAKSNDLRSFC